MSAEPVLYYFDGRGRAEIVRLFLCAAGIKFSEVHLTERKEFLKLIEDGMLLFGMVPMLTLDGMNFVETNALVNYISAKGGFDGKDASEKAWIDMYYEGSRGLYAPFLGLLFVGTVQETLAKVKKNLTKYLPAFNKALEKSTSGFIVGSAMTRADLGILEALLAITESLGEEVLQPYPYLGKFVNKMRSIKSIAYYMDQVRKGQNTEDYVSNVNAVFGW